MSAEVGGRGGMDKEDDFELPFNVDESELVDDDAEEDDCPLGWDMPRSTERGPSNTSIRPGIASLNSGYIYQFKKRQR